MALRIKCKCGKSLKVSSQLADKKLLCPGCKKAFRIPAEKFKQAGAASPAPAAKPQPAVAKKAPPVPKPKSEVPMPAPVELDLLPDKIDWSSADLSVSQSDILSDLIPDAKPTAASPSGKLGLTCPLCRKVLPPGAVLCVDCGFNAATRTYIKTSLPPVASAVTTAPTTGYAADLSRMSRGSHIDHDVVQAPKRSFWADALRSFSYPFMSANNGVVFGMIVLADSFRILLRFVIPFVPCILTAVAVFLAVVAIRGWIAAVMLSVIHDTATGSEELPGIKIQDGAMEDVIKPLFKYIGAGACALLPASIYLLLMAGGVLPGTFASGLNLVLLILVGIFVWPIFLMLFAFDAPGKIFRIDQIATTIFHTFVPYLGLWLMLVLASFGSILTIAALLTVKAGININVPQVPQIPGLAGELIFNTINLYLGIVSMRLIGLYYLHFKRRFTMVME
jgi:hypothetical protein